MAWRLLFQLTVVMVSALSFTNAAVKEVREYRLRPPRDRKILFAMALTPDQDVLSFIANPDGKWRLSRVRGWLDKEPREDSIVVPGLVLGDRRKWFSNWSAKLLVSQDGKFAVCIASAFLSRGWGQGQDEFVSVVNLTEFKVIASIRSPTIGALAGDYPGVSFQSHGPPRRSSVHSLSTPSGRRHQ
jgi:hypothetical protein